MDKEHYEALRDLEHQVSFSRIVIDDVYKNIQSQINLMSTVLQGCEIYLSEELKKDQKNIRKHMETYVSKLRSLLDEKREEYKQKKDEANH